MPKGYFTSVGFIGYVDGRKMLFDTYSDYVEYLDGDLEPEQADESEHEPA